VKQTQNYLFESKSRLLRHFIPRNDYLE